MKLPTHTCRIIGTRSGPSVAIIGGTHGDELTGIEVVKHFLKTFSLDDCSAGLEVEGDINGELFLIFGNPEAIRKGVRYLENDVNRMFCGAYQHLRQDAETERAAQLEQRTAQFFEQSGAEAQRYHYDLHTAIRASLLPVFALIRN